jgi:hypothetical protein
MSGKRRKQADTSIVKVDALSLEENQLAEQLYNSAGLDPVVEAGLKDYDQQLQQESKLLNRVLGPRQSDIQGYGAAVAKRVAHAVYALLNRQYGGKVGDLRSYIMTIEEERDRATVRYDELLGRVVGILGDEYRQLRTDSNAFMEKLTTVLGDDLEASKINQEALASRLADIDGLREQIRTLETAADVRVKRHGDEMSALKAEKQQELETVSAELSHLRGELDKRNEIYETLLADLRALANRVPSRDIGESLGSELRDFLLDDSKVPHMVLEGIGKFIDFKKYLSLAADRGASDITTQLKAIVARE